MTRRQQHAYSQQTQTRAGLRPQSRSQSYKASFQISKTKLKPIFSKVTMTISRQYPTNLNLHLTNSTSSRSTSRSTSNINYSERQWEEFCDGIDAILIRLASLHQSNSRISTLLLLVFMIALILTCSILFFQCLYKSKSKYNLFLFDQDFLQL